MRKLSTLIILLFCFNLSAHAQVYEFSGNVSFLGNNTLAAVFGDASTFTATLTFDTSQTSADAAASFSAADESSTYDYYVSYYDIGSMVYQLGDQTWSYSGGYLDDNWVLIRDGIDINDAIHVDGYSVQTLGNGLIINYAYLNAFSLGTGLLNSTDASGLLAYDSMISRAGSISTSEGSILLSGISVTSAVPEPATWLMMLIGFGMVTSLHRRKSRPQSRQAL